MNALKSVARTQRVNTDLLYIVSVDILQYYDDTI